MSEIYCPQCITRGVYQSKMSTTQHLVDGLRWRMQCESFGFDCNEHGPFADTPGEAEEAYLKESGG